MLPKKVIRRNTVVVHKKGSFYGRVIRMLSDGRVFWLCSGYHFHITKPEDLEATGYKGRWIDKWDFSGKRWSHMTTLRRLKKRATRYHDQYAHNTPLDYHNITED